MKKMMMFFKKTLSKKKLAYATPGFIVVDREKNMRYSFSDSWCYASESK